MWKRMLTGVLAAVYLLTAMPLLHLAAGESDPWDDHADWPTLSALNTILPGNIYFTGKEWTGEMPSKDINGMTVKQSNVFGVNREEAHATDTVPYDSVENAVAGAVSGDFTHSPYYRLLTGEGEAWDLTVYKNLTAAEEAGVAQAFYDPAYTGVAENPYTGKGVVSDYDNADYGCGWRSVILPASWQTQGFDFAIYSNIDTPWKGVYGNEGGGMADRDLVPAVPTVTNPVGFYRRTFDVDEQWLQNGKKVYISFQGVESAMYLYVNGHEVGYTEDSYDAHDFDITAFLNADGKDNVLAVRVHRWCDGSWIEDQDFLRLGGIFRDVYLYTTPAVYIRDYKVETDLDDTYTDAQLNLSVQVANRSTQTADSYGLDVQVFDADGDAVLTEPLRADVTAIESGDQTTVALSRPVKSPRLWSDEDPYLYTMVISLYEKTSGKLFGCVSQQLGFREITFTKTQVDANYNKVTTSYERILLNGKPLLFRGVNRHDNDPATGKYVSHELYERDILIMKENNINAVRTSHYPDDRYFYYLCDKYGILVMAETNMESHSLQHDSDVMASHFTAAFRDRLTANIQAQKNRACVVMWSLGNECGDTPQTKMFQRAIQEVVRKLDSTRPVHYEGLQNRGGVDVYSNMYPQVKDLDDRGTTADHMPYVLCEYAFSQGNSSGNLKEYWDKIRQYDNMLGAFIWDFVDKSLETPLPTPQVLTVDQSTHSLKASLNGTIGDSDEWGKVLSEGHVVMHTSDALDEALSGRRSFTLEMQVNPHGSGQYQTLMAKGDHQVSLRVYDDARLDLVLFAGGEWRVSTFRLPANWKDTWHHVAVLFDGTQVTMYCDGVRLGRIDNAAISSAIPRSDYAFAINYDTETGRIGDNEVAMARVYSRLLTTEELTAQDNADHGKGDYAVSPQDESVMLWMDFTAFTPEDYHTDTDAVWDYYAEIGREDMAGKYYAYGGDWGDVIHSGSYLADGLVSADRTVQPEMQEVAYVYQPVWFSATDEQLSRREITIQNEHRFVDTSRYILEWELLEDGVVCDSGELEPVISPLSEQTVTVPFALPQTRKAGAEYFLNLRAVLRETTNGVAAQTVMAHEQIVIPAEVALVSAVNAATLPSVSCEDSDTALTLIGERFSLTFDKASGVISSYVYDGETLLTQGPTPNYWRAQMDSDRQNSEWRSAGRTAQLASLRASIGNGAVTVTVNLQLPDAGTSRQEYIYTVYGSGEVRVEATLYPDRATGELLKYGAELLLPADFETIAFYGEGPEESYTDRRQGTQVGVYTTTVKDSFYPFVRPQTSGNHTGVRWMALEKENGGIGLAVVGNQPLEASALAYRVSDYAGCDHPYELPRTDYTVLNVDSVSCGLGGANCGPAALEEYRLYADHTYTYTYTLLPYEVGVDDVMERSKAWRAATSEEPIEPTTMKGDTDANGKVNTTDARIVLQYAAGLIDAEDIDLTAADVDDNDKVNTTDARRILQFAAGIIQAF